MSERTGLNPLASQRIQTELKNIESSTDPKNNVIKSANKSFQEKQDIKEELK